MRGAPREPGESGGALDLTKVKGSPIRPVAAQLIEGDPLGLESVATARRDELGYLIASDRMLLRTATLVAYHACVYGVERANDEWIAGLIDQAIENLLTEDSNADRRDTPVEPHDEYAYQAVMELLDVPAEVGRAICVAFNALPEPTRLAYFEFSRRESEAAQQALEAGEMPAQLRERLALALMKLLGGNG